MPDSFIEINVISQDLTAEIKEDSTDINVIIDIKNRDVIIDNSYIYLGLELR